MYLTWVRFGLSPFFVVPEVPSHTMFLAAIATSLQCLIADEEMNDGRGEYHDEGLKSFVDKHATEGDEYEG